MPDFFVASFSSDICIMIVSVPVIHFVVGWAAKFGLNPRPPCAEVSALKRDGEGVTSNFIQ